jgi:hypothetical protein
MDDKYPITETCSIFPLLGKKGIYSRSSDSPKKKGDIMDAKKIRPNSEAKIIATVF